MKILCTCKHFLFSSQWLETRPERQECPVCKAGISREKVVPLYGRGSQKPQDPRLKTPPRPQGQRPAPESRGGFQPFGDTGGFHFSFGVGAFPFGFFTTVFNTHDPFRRGAGKSSCLVPARALPQTFSWLLKLSFLLQVWIWDRVTRPPAGKIPSSCLSPSSSFSGCSVFELCPTCPPLARGESVLGVPAGPSLLLDHPLTSMTRLCLRRPPSGGPGEE